MLISKYENEFFNLVFLLLKHSEVQVSKLEVDNGVVHWRSAVQRVLTSCPSCPSFLCSVLNSKLPYDVTPEQAMAHEEVRNRLEASIKNMKTITDKFLSAIIVSVDKIP